MGFNLYGMLLCQIQLSAWVKPKKSQSSRTSILLPVDFKEQLRFY